MSTCQNQLYPDTTSHSSVHLLSLTPQNFSTLAGKRRMVLQCSPHHPPRAQYSSLHPNPHQQKLFDDGISVFYTEEASFRKIHRQIKSIDRHKNTYTSEQPLFQSATNMVPNVRRTLPQLGRAVEQRVPVRIFQNWLKSPPHPTGEEEGRGNR